RPRGRGVGDAVSQQRSLQGVRARATTASARAHRSDGGRANGAAGEAPGARHVERRTAAHLVARPPVTGGRVHDRRRPDRARRGAVQAALRARGGDARIGVSGADTPGRRGTGRTEWHNDLRRAGERAVRSSRDHSYGRGNAARHRQRAVPRRPRLTDRRDSTTHWTREGWSTNGSGARRVYWDSRRTLLVISAHVPPDLQPG